MTQSGGNHNVTLTRIRSRATARTFSRVARAVMLATAFTTAGCYKFGGGGGFPPDLKTVAILPFDNQTATPEVQRELNEYLRKAFHDRLNLRDAPEEKADVVVKGIIGKLEVDLPAGVSADPRQANQSRRRLQLVLDVEITNMKTGRPLLKNAGMQSEGQYPEGREEEGRKLAIEKIVDMMIQGTQSQW